VDVRADARVVTASVLDHLSGGVEERIDDLLELT